MGCFIGCFGVSNKKKRTKPANRVLHGDLKLVSYEPLDSSVSTNLDIPENPINSNSQLSKKAKERLSIKIRKKVSFNPNVQTYEPIPAEKTTTYHFLQNVEEEENENNGAEAEKWSLPSLSYPTNHRYQNCRESYDDEEDEMMCDESDLDDDDDYFYDNDEDENGDGENDVEDRGQRREELLDELKSVGSGNARIRSQDLCSVLNPVENTAQWKEIKSRSAAAPKHRRKENVELEEAAQILFGSNRSPNYNLSKPLLQDTAVDASLTNWLISPNIDQSKAKGSTRSCNFAFDTLLTKKNICDASFSSRYYKSETLVL